MDAADSGSEGEEQQTQQDQEGGAEGVAVEVEYVDAPLPAELESSEALAEVARAFHRLRGDDDKAAEDAVAAAAEGEAAENAEAQEGQEGAAEQTLSKKKKRAAKRMPHAELKQRVRRPDLVEYHDVSSPDPLLLLELKALRNTVPVPRHWSQKKKYLQGKRGFEKPPFQLPAFIEATGISQLRSVYNEKEDAKSLKQKQRDKMAPKMGRLDIDYQVLHDAFFKHQTKPKLLGHGDLYYEGKEFEVDTKKHQPGKLSDELKMALGMPLNDHRIPPPWLISMQRYGPPPSYPHLRIPGVNAPIPPGCNYGFHPGGWGQAPVDEAGRPLYGDVFGTQTRENDVPAAFVEPIQKMRWGELDESDGESEEEEQDEDGDADGTRSTVPGTATDSGLLTAQGIVSNASSIPSGIQTPQHIDLRKDKRAGLDSDDRNLFTVLPQKETGVGQSTFGSAHTYVVPGSTKGAAGAQRVDLMKSQKTEGIDVALDPDELADMTDDTIRQRFDDEMRAKRGDADKGEDLSDLFAEQERKRKHKQQAKASEPKHKKYKDLDF
eukprot:TRINITY_DN2132_c0_g1_i1.p1 TRINITY_DN2132_c0_g1~~TRINITY_DN2132_c0_g1_i1.p1  ORF type:complete len:574 (+),score=161.23 TRINITY_DN2132_c0_g1_i1:78-1724(+)